MDPELVDEAMDWVTRKVIKWTGSIDISGQAMGLYQQVRACENSFPEIIEQVRLHVKGGGHEGSGVFNMAKFIAMAETLPDNLSLQTFVLNVIRKFNINSEKTRHLGEAINFVEQDSWWMTEMGSNPDVVKRVRLATLLLGDENVHLADDALDLLKDNIDRGMVRLRQMLEVLITHQDDKETLEMLKVDPDDTLEVLSEEGDDMPQVEVSPEAEKAIKKLTAPPKKKGRKRADNNNEGQGKGSGGVKEPVSTRVNFSKGQMVKRIDYLQAQLEAYEAGVIGQGDGSGLEWVNLANITETEREVVEVFNRGDFVEDTCDELRITVSIYWQLMESAQRKYAVFLEDQGIGEVLQG